MKIPAKKGHDEIRVTFPPSGHVNHPEERMYSDRSDIKDTPRNEHEAKKAEKAAKVYEYFEFEE